MTAHQRLVERLAHGYHHAWAVEHERRPADWGALSKPLQTMFTEVAANAVRAMWTAGLVPVRPLFIRSDATVMASMPILPAGHGSEAWEATEAIFEAVMEQQWAAKEESA